MISKLVLVSAFAAATLCWGPARSQAYPVKPVRIVSPYPPGGIGDTTTRAVGIRLEKLLGQPIVVQPMPGASQAIAAAAVARAEPDGYTLLLASPTSMVLNPLTRSSLPYDPAGFALVSRMFSSPFIVVVGSQLPATTIGEFIALARKNPGAMNYGSIGEGSSSHLAAALFAQLADIRMTHVPYKGSSGTNVELINGNLQIIFDPGAGTFPLIREGRLRALAVTTAKRVAALPDVPTLAEAGIPLEMEGWFGLVAPGGTPRPVVDRLVSAVAESVRDPALREQFAKFATDFEASTPEEFAQFVKRDAERWAKVAATLGIKPQ